MIQVRITLPVYIRKGPGKSYNPPLGSINPSGNIITMDGVEVGESWKGINKWYYKTNAKGEKQYYWGGRVSEVENAERKSDGIYYNQFLKNFDQTLINNQGLDTSIIIIDEGIVVNKTFFNENLIKNIAIDNNLITSFHGNFIGGIIAGRRNIFGIIPKARVISLKYKYNNSTLEELLLNLKKSLEYVLTAPGPLIVNLSQGFDDSTLNNNINEKTQIINLIKQISLQKNKFIVCAAGDNLDIRDCISFPAYLDNCISVGCINDAHNDILISEHLNILTPMVDYTSFGIDFSNKSCAGSSFSTAVISSLVNCIVSNGNKNGVSLKNADILQKLKPYSINKSEFIYNELKTFQFQTFNQS